MSYKVNLGGWNSVFAVPTAVVDNYIKLASGNNIKVLLYFLRHAGENVSNEEISAATKLDSDTVSDSLLFWEQLGLIALSEGEIKPSEKPQAVAMNAPAAPVAADPMLSVKKVELTRETVFKPMEIASTIRGSAEMDYFFKSVEKLFKRPLKPYERNTLMVMTEETGLPVPVALMLIDYCCSVEKASTGSLKAFALDWIERDIKTVEAAEEEIVRLKASNDIQRELRRRFEMSSGFSKQQKEMIDVWSRELGFAADMIDAAYQASLDGAGKLSFKYMDKVLRSWHDKGIDTTAALDADRAKYKESKKQTAEGGKPSFDTDEFMQSVIKGYGGQG